MKIFFIMTISTICMITAGFTGLLNAATPQNSETEIVRIFKLSVNWVNPPDIAKENRETIIRMGPSVLPEVLPIMEQEYLMQQYGLQDIIYGMLKQYEPADTEQKQKALQHLKTEIAGHLRDHLRSSSYEGLRWVVRWLAELNVDPDNDVKAVVTQINHPFWRVRAAVAHALGLLKTHTGTPYLNKLMKDPFEEVRAQAAVSAGMINDPVLINPLSNLLNDPLFPARMNAADALVKTALAGYQVEVETRVTPALLAENAKTRCLAMEILGRCGSVKTLEIIEPFLHSRDKLMRGFAVEAAGAIGTSTARIMLENIRKTEQDPFVLAQLEKIMGDNFGNREKLYPGDY